MHFSNLQENLPYMELDRHVYKGSAYPLSFTLKIVIPHIYNLFL
jgi:hypothetical protein